MADSVVEALRILGHFWLEEVRPADLELLARLPELAQTLPDPPAEALTELAVEYQRLFGFNLPLYESVFVDPSAMLLAPATQRLEQLYRLAGWSPPAGSRTGAPDHLGLELLAQADWLAAGQLDLADRLQVDHLALWLPAFVATLRRLNPHPFYATLAELTLTLTLSTLAAEVGGRTDDPFPELPPAPVYRGTEDTADPDEQPAAGRGAVFSRLLVPGEAGLYLTREDIGRLSRQLDLPAAMGERRRMLETLVRSAEQYDLLPPLGQRLERLLHQVAEQYQAWATQFPAWRPYGAAWRRRLAESRAVVRERFS